MITCRLAKKTDNAGLLGKMSYGDLMEDLSTVWRKVDAQMNKSETGDNYWVHILQSVFKELEAFIFRIFRSLFRFKMHSKQKICGRST